MADETQSTAPEQETQEQGTTPETVEAPADKQPDSPMIPKARFDEVNERLKSLKKVADEFEALKQAQADEAAQKSNDIEKFKTERDQYKGEARQWQSYAEGKIETLAEQLDDSGKAILEQLGDEVPLAKRLAIAEQLSSQKKPDAGMGTTGGKSSGDVGGIIPPEVGSMAEYHNWMANLQSDPKGRALLGDRKKMAAIREEARRKFN